MKLWFLDFDFAQILIDDERCNIETLRLQSELAMNVNYPFKKKSSRGVSDLSLNFADVAWVNHKLLFLRKHRLVNFLSKLGNILGILHVFCVFLGHQRHLLSQIILNSRPKFLCNLLSMIIFFYFSLFGQTNGVQSCLNQFFLKNLCLGGLLFGSPRQSLDAFLFGWHDFGNSWGKFLSFRGLHFFDIKNLRRFITILFLLLFLGVLILRLRELSDSLKGHRINLGDVPSLLSLLGPFLERSHSGVGNRLCQRLHLIILIISSRFFVPFAQKEVHQINSIQFYSC